MNTLLQGRVLTQALGFLAFLFLIAGSCWHIIKVNTSVILDDEAFSNTVNTTISQLTIKQFNAAGVLINQLSSPLMEHIPKDNIHWFQKPNIIVIKNDNEPSWNIHALKAKSINGGKSITFMNQVVVHQNSDNKKAGSTFKTEEITYYPEEKKATTDFLVTLIQSGNTIQSTGMNAWLDKQKVELLHQAKGIYEPPANA